MVENWNPWRMITIGMALVMSTALITGLVVANWVQSDTERGTLPATTAAPAGKAPSAPATPARAAAPAPPRSVVASATTAAVPLHSAIATCNEVAAREAGRQDKTVEVVKDTALGAAIGAAVGAAGGAVANGGRGAGTGAAIGGIVGAGGGTLYGLNENRKHDERYRSAYASCMRARGYAG